MSPRRSPQRPSGRRCRSWYRKACARVSTWALIAAASGARGAHAAEKDSVSRLKIVNGCRTAPIWIAHMAIWPENGGVGPDPQNLKLMPGESYNFNTPPGLSGTRYWPKMGCDSSGNDCKFGDSGGPDEICNENGCAPPVDTKFEASFGKDKTDQDWVDISLVDGYTLPFRFELDGKCGAGFDGTDDGGDGVDTNQYYSIDSTWAEHCDVGTGRRYFRSPEGKTTYNPPRIIDCSRLDFKHCPEGEDISAGGAKERKNVSLKVAHPSKGGTVGCYSPCSQLSLSHWSEEGAKFYGPPDDEAAPYCCPTPPESPESCRAGPVATTKFVKGVHQMCPGVYGYSYDDGMGLLQCPVDTKYKVTFYCPVDEAPVVAKSDPLLPALKPLMSTACTTTTNGALGFTPEDVLPVRTQSTVRAQSTLPPYTGPEPANLPEDVVPRPASTFQVTSAMQRSTSNPFTMPRSTSNLAVPQELVFASVTSTTTVETTGTQLQAIIVTDSGTQNELQLAPSPSPSPSPSADLPKTPAPMPSTSTQPYTMAAATQVAEQKLRFGSVPTPRPPAAAQRQPAAPKPPPPPPPPPPPLPPPPLPLQPTPAPAPSWQSGFRSALHSIGLASEPRKLSDASSATAGQRIIYALGFLGLLTAFVTLGSLILWRRNSPRPIIQYQNDEYGPMHLMQHQQSSFAGYPGPASGAPSMTSLSPPMGSAMGTRGSAMGTSMSMGPVGGGMREATYGYR